MRALRLFAVLAACVAVSGKHCEDDCERERWSCESKRGGNVVGVCKGRCEYRIAADSRAEFERRTDLLRSQMSSVRVACPMTEPAYKEYAIAVKLSAKVTRGEFDGASKFEGFEVIDPVKPFDLSIHEETNPPNCGDLEDCSGYMFFREATGYCQASHGLDGVRIAVQWRLEGEEEWRSSSAARPYDADHFGESDSPDGDGYYPYSYGGEGYASFEFEYNFREFGVLADLGIDYDKFLELTGTAQGLKMEVKYLLSAKYQETGESCVVRRRRSKKMV